MSETLHSTFRERVEVHQAGPCALYILPSPVEQVISFAGSIKTMPDLAAGDELVQELVTDLLDKGTMRRDRFAVADLIDNRGAQLHFRSNGTRIAFSGRTLREDLEDVLRLLAEQLREPLFDPAEFEKARANLNAEIRRSMENTGSQATSALVRQLFRPGHPNYSFTPEAELEALSLLSVESVTQFYEAHAGARELTLVLVGDLHGYPVEGIVREVFDGWDLPAAAGIIETQGVWTEPERIAVAVPDKQNLDVRIGHALPVRRDHADFLPLFFGNFVLGGNFSARLMTVVRDRMGLTYGIGSQLAGTSTEHDGYWRLGVTLSPGNLERGIDAALDEVRRIVEEGITNAELEANKTTITGSFKVDLATTGGLSQAILVNVLRGFGAGYLDDFPAEVMAITRDEVESALRKYLHPNRVHIVVAGSLEAT